MTTPRIDFAFGAQHRLRTACHVTQRHYMAGHALIIYTQDEKRLRRFDQWLWRFEPTAFIPHVFHDDANAAAAAIVLSSQNPSLVLAQRNDHQTPWLLNLDLDCPPSYEHFARILEIVSEHEADKQAARERWRQYQAAGHTLRAHKLTGT